MREKNKLSQANLGEIDPTSETIKLVTLGLRGIATFALENKATNYKLKEDWTKLKATPGADHQAATQLSQRVGKRGLEPVAQYFRPVRRLS